MTRSTPYSTPRSAATAGGGYIISSARAMEPSRDSAEERRQQAIVEAAFRNVKAANDGVLAEQKRLRQMEAAAKDKKYREAQAAYKRRQIETQESARSLRSEHGEKVRQDFQLRKQEELAQAQQRKVVTQQRTKHQAEQAKEEQEAKLREEARLKALQVRYNEQRTRKEAQAEAKAKQTQLEILEEATEAKLETKAFEEAKAKREAEFLAASRKVKREMNEEAARKVAAEKARKEELVKSRFKASEEERIRREAEKRAQEKAETRKLREVHRRRMEEEHKKKRAEARQKAKELKEALREAAALQYEADEQGKRRLKADPTKELQKKMRKLEAEREKAMQERDAEIGAKKVALERKDKEDAFQRSLQVQAAQREVAATFKKNQEKELADRLSREAAEKDRFRKIAKEMRWKIEEDNRRKREAELQAAINLKEMKAAQYEADLAAHKRREKMRDLKAKQSRHLQEVAWMDVMEWEELAAGQERDKRESAAALFSEQRATKAADDEELAQVRLYYEQRMKLDLEEKRAKRASGEAQRFEDAVRQTAELARAMAAEVKGMRSARSQPDIETEDTSKKVFSNPFEGFSLALPTFSWGKRVTIAAAPGD